MVTASSIWEGRWAGKRSVIASWTSSGWVCYFQLPRWRWPSSLPKERQVTSSALPVCKFTHSTTVHTLSSATWQITQILVPQALWLAGGGCENTGLADGAWQPRGRSKARSRPWDLVAYRGRSASEAEPARPGLATKAGKWIIPHRYRFQKQRRKKRIPEDAQREKAQNKLPIQPTLWKRLILRFSFCCCAQSYQRSGYERADDSELSELLPVSCMSSESSAGGWLGTQLIAVDPAALRGEQILFLTPFECPVLHFPRPRCSGRNDLNPWI